MATPLTVTLDPEPGSTVTVMVVPFLAGSSWWNSSAASAADHSMRAASANRMWGQGCGSGMWGI